MRLGYDKFSGTTKAKQKKKPWRKMKRSFANAITL